MCIRFLRFTRRRIQLIAILIWLATTNGVAQEIGSFRDNPNIWTNEIVMEQPFDKEPFHAIKPAQWVLDSYGAGYTLSVSDSDSRVAAVQHGVSMSELGFVDPFFTYYKSDLLHNQSPHVSETKLRADIAEYEQLGIRILAVYPPCLQSEVYLQHPDWRRIPTDTTEVPMIDMEQFGHGGMLCLLGPYGDFFIDVLCEIATKFPEVDGFTFDGIHYGGCCYCQHCRQNYRRETNKEIPPPDMADATFREYQHWADRKMENLLIRMQTRLKRINPELAIVSWTTNAGRWGHFLSIPRNMPTRMNLLMDAPDQEFWLDETNKGTTVVPAIASAYMWATTNHRVGFSEPYILSHGNPYGKDSFPPHEILRRMMLTLTYGAQPSIAVSQPSYLQQALYDNLDQIVARHPWMTHKQPESWGAILLSDNSRNFYGYTGVEEKYMANVLGMFRTMIEEHLQVVLINDWNLTDKDLAKYKVLILPNAACLGKNQIDAVRRFVRRGGGLVATLDTSLYDEFGGVRANFGLEDVFGVRFKGVPVTSAGGKSEEIDVNFLKGVGPDYWNQRKGIFSHRNKPGSFLDSGLMQLYVGPDPVTFKGAANEIEVTLPTAEVVGTFEARGAGAGLLPGVVTNAYGKGRVVYMSGAYDAGYYLYPYPYQRLMMASSIRWAARSPETVKVDAPMCVHSQVFRQDRNGQRLIVNLFSDLNTAGDHARPEDDVPLREEAIPIPNIKVVFGPDYRVSSVKSQPDNLSLPMTKLADGSIQVTLPSLEVHQFVVAELTK